MDNVESPVETVVVDDKPGSSAVPGPPQTQSDPDAPQPLSKKAIKKAAKAERITAQKLERRAREKEAKKEKKRVIAAKRAAGELDEDEEKRRQKKRPWIHFGGKVVVDLGFDDLMNEKEVISLCSQLAYTYSANRNAAYPFTLLYTSLNGRTFTRLESQNDAGYKRWTNTEWWQEGYEQLWQGQAAPPIFAPDEANISALVEPIQPPTSEGWSAVQQSVIYLTADSEEELTELKPEESYIIGGICDHNRYKNLCLNKAKESGIRTARLPIGRYLASLPTRKVLTVNQVFEILLKWVETRDWEEAFHSVIPKRKFQSGGKGAKASSETGDASKDGETKDGEIEEEGEELVVLEEQEQEEDGDEDR
ncbi:hypothetical protein DXG03_000142 [Asterophora parasitica]|uniref:tRNA (guanine(9)-N1)-methyltransferase n=1 Tax=Asterophora parasitica TaxID=117018 RepID=A0A9P7KFQ4_9AGAR|nr:hypothetical protein DXG03_000142 [Asterophora parasitica]